MAEESATINVEHTPPPTPIPDDPFSLYLSVLELMRRPRQHLTTVPTFVPKNFAESIQFVDTGTKSVYCYINGSWVPLISPWTHLSTTSTGGDVDDITITVPTGYSLYRLTAYLVQNNTGGTDHLLLRFNGDTGTNYDRQRLEGAGSTTTASSASGATLVDLGQGPAATYGVLELFFQSWATSEKKSGHAHLDCGGARIVHTGFNWNNTANLITSLGFSFQFGVGTRKINGKFILEGIL